MRAVQALFMTISRLSTSKAMEVWIWTLYDNGWETLLSTLILSGTHCTSSCFSTPCPLSELKDGSWKLTRVVSSDVLAGPDEELKEQMKTLELSFQEGNTTLSLSSCTGEQVYLNALSIAMSLVKICCQRSVQNSLWSRDKLRMHMAILRKWCKKQSM